MMSGTDDHDVIVISDDEDEDIGQPCCKRQRCSSDREEVPLTKKTREIPKEFLCPISLDIMTDPVVASDGCSYDKSYLETWFRTSDSKVLPATKQKQRYKSLIPNLNLKSQIERFRKENNI